MTAILTGLQKNLIVVLICISMTSKNVEHFFLYLLTIYPSFEDCPINLPITDWVICYFVPVFFLYLCIFWILIPVRQITNKDFLTLGNSLFILVIVSFGVKTFTILVCCYGWQYWGVRTQSLILGRQGLSLERAAFIPAIIFWAITYAYILKCFSVVVSKFQVLH
jgi:hypothetical protein